MNNKSIYKEFNDSNKKIIQLQKEIDRLITIKNENDYLIEDLKNENTSLITENKNLKENNEKLKDVISTYDTSTIIVNLIKTWLGEDVINFLNLVAYKARKDAKQMQEDKKL